MEEKLITYGTYMTGKEEREMFKRVEERENNGLAQQVLERAEKWLINHPDALEEFYRSCKS